MISFRTRGNFIDFVLIEDTSLQQEHILMSLHNTSKAIDWSYDENPLTISFTINEAQYSNIPISTIDFDGTTLTTQAGFETGIEAMFPNLAGGGGGGSSYLVKATPVTLTDAQIKALPTTPIEVVPAPGEGKFISLVQGIIILDNVAGAYSNLAGGFLTELFFAVGPLPTPGAMSNLYIESDMGDLEFPGSSPYPIIFSPGANIGTGIFASAGPPDADAVNNKPMYFRGTNGGNGDFTGGNAANTLKITVYYIVVDL